MDKITDIETINLKFENIIILFIAIFIKAFGHKHAAVHELNKFFHHL